MDGWKMTIKHDGIMLGNSGQSNNEAIEAASSIFIPIGSSGGHPCIPHADSCRALCLGCY